MRVNLNLNDEELAMLVREGQRRTSLVQGEAAAQFWVDALVTKELQRIQGWERTFIATPRTPRPLGRPVEDARYYHIKQIAEHLGGIYLRLRNLYPTTFEENHSNDERSWQEKVRERDLDWLVEFEARQPWIKKP